MIFKEKLNSYVQPECSIIQLQVEQMIATSGSASADSNEEYEEESTNGWF